MAKSRKKKKLSTMDWAKHKRYPGSILCLNCRIINPSVLPGPRIVAYCATCQQKGKVKSTLARAMEKAAERRRRQREKEREDQS